MARRCWRATSDRLIDTMMIRYAREGANFSRLSARTGVHADMPRHLRAAPRYLPPIDMVLPCLWNMNIR